MDRVIFMGREFTEGYVGKKILVDRRTDHVIIESPGLPKITRKDKLDIADIEGAKPSLKVQAIENVQKYKKSFEKLSMEKRHKTESNDSLDFLLQHKFGNEAEKWQQPSTKRLYSIESEVSKNLAGKNYEITKRNLGLISQSPEIPDTKQKLMRSPTYISSFHAFE